MDEETKQPLKLVCETCGPVNTAHVHGYDVGDVLLEGVKFQIYLDASGKITQVTLGEEDSAYFKQKHLSLKKWTPEVMEFAQQCPDSLTCVQCGGDLAQGEEAPGIE